MARRGVKISRSKIIETVISPEYVDQSRLPQLIAQSELDSGHVVRVVYKIDRGEKVIITFYPGRKSQYEKK